MPSGKNNCRVAKEGMLKRNDQGQAAAAFYVKRAKWLDYLSTHSEIGHTEFRVAYFMARHMNGEDQCMWWQVKAIAKEVGCSPTVVSAATIKFEDLGLMIVTRPKRGVNRYYIRMPYEQSDLT